MPCVLLSFGVLLWMFVCSNMEIEVPVPPGVTYETDPDKLKLFVGQIPKEYEDEEIRSLLEEFGPIHEINIIKDKDKRSKGQKDPAFSFT